MSQLRDESARLASDYEATVPDLGMPMPKNCSCEEDFRMTAFRSRLRPLTGHQVSI